METCYSICVWITLTGGVIGGAGLWLFANGPCEFTREFANTFLVVVLNVVFLGLAVVLIYAAAVYEVFPALAAFPFFSGLSGAVVLVTFVVIEKCHELLTRVFHKG